MVNWNKSMLKCVTKAYSYLRVSTLKLPFIYIFCKDSFFCTFTLQV